MTFREKCIKEYAKNKPDLEQVMRVLYPSDYGYEKEGAVQVRTLKNAENAGI